MSNNVPPADPGTLLDRLKQAYSDIKADKPTQVKLAKFCRVSQPVVSSWGKDGLPAMDTCVTIAKELNVCVEWLYTGRGPKSPRATDEQAQRLWDVWRELSIETRGTLVKFAEASRIGRGRDEKKASNG